MKNWFPFTDYDFYAYITSGVLLIAAIDYSLFEGVLVFRSEWSLVQGIFWTMVSYLVGHVVAGPAALIMEHLLLKKLLADPVNVILGLKKQSWIGTSFRLLFASEYQAFPEPVQSRVKARLEAAIKAKRLVGEPPEALFHVAFGAARYMTDCESRLDHFMKLYGLCRNVAFVGFVASVLLSVRAYETRQNLDISLAWVALVLGAGMFGRFIKFYSAYTREIFRAFERQSK